MGGGHEGGGVRGVGVVLRVAVGVAAGVVVGLSWGW